MHLVRRLPDRDTWDPSQDRGALSDRGGDLNISIDLMSAGKHIRQSVPQRHTHLLDVEALSVIADFHHHTLVRNPYADRNVLAPGILGCILEGLLADLEQRQ